jgi:type I restriction enzyme M protein
MLKLQCAFEFPEESFAHKLIKASALLDQDRVLKAEIKADAAALHLLTKSTIEDLSDEQVYELLELKWIFPFNAALHQLPTVLIDTLTAKIQALADKYKITYADNARAIQQTEASLANLIDELDGNAFDMQGLDEFKNLLKGE